MANYIFHTDDRNEYEIAFHGLDFLMALWEMDQWLRSEIKYAQKEQYQPVREKLFEILEDNGVNLDMLQ